MNILIQLSHPAHFHLYKNAIRNYQEDGHMVFVLIKTKDILENLLHNAGIEYFNILPIAHRGSKLGILWDMIVRDWRIMRFCRKHAIDILSGSTPEVAQVAWLLGLKSINTTEDDATCTADGYKKSTCITCGYVAENIVTPATGHTVEIIDTVDATCTENGSATYACTVCDLKVTEENKVEWVAEIGGAEAVKFNDAEVVSKGAGENKQYLVYKLTNGNKTPAYPELGHSISYDDNNELIYTITKAPTCISEGEKAIVCTVCGYTTGSLAIEKADDAHVFAGKIIYVAPKCEEDGYYYLFATGTTTSSPLTSASKLVSVLEQATTARAASMYNALFIICCLLINATGCVFIAQPFFVLLPEDVISDVVKCH